MASPLKRRATYDNLLQVLPHRVADGRSRCTAGRKADGCCSRRTRERRGPVPEPFDAVDLGLAPLWGEGG
jgi:hypothetical protein